MPWYTYKCADPDHGVINLSCRIADRDRQVCPLQCGTATDFEFGLDHPCGEPLTRLPDAPNFAVQGFNARNGYSR